MTGIIKSLLFCCLVTLLLISCGRKADGIELIDGMRSEGDSIRWAQKTYDDKHWSKKMEPKENVIFWVRMKTQINTELAQQHNQGLKIVAFGNFEAYWDGNYLGRNGLVQTGNKGNAGTYLSYYVLPNELLTEGEHVLALRMIKTKMNVPFYTFAILDDYFQLVTGPLQFSKYFFLTGGVFLIIAIYFFFIFINQPKDISSLLFSIICLIFLCLLLAEYSKLFYPYPYPFQITRMEIIGYCHIVLTCLIPLFYAIHFSFEWKKWLLGTLLILVLVLEFNFHRNYDFIAILHNALLFIFSFIIAAHSTYKHKKGAVIVMVGLLICIGILYFMSYFEFDYVTSFDISIYISFVIIVVTMLYIMAVKRKDDRLAYESSLLQSERLKNELLKKNIKPHFIMNTLTSLMDWVEESPKEGVKFISALAEEFDVLNEIADYKLIPISQEIKLCQNHLKIMRYRKEINYLWQEEGIDPNEFIPPAIIHTLVENGVTHNFPDAYGNISFHLSFSREKNSKQYILRTLAKQRPEYAKKDIKQEGTGLKYIKSRLQESYPNHWNLLSNPLENGWETLIKIEEP
jgi:hypothetical protein